MKNILSEIIEAVSAARYRLSLCNLPTDVAVYLTEDQRRGVCRYLEHSRYVWINHSGDMTILDAPVYVVSDDRHGMQVRAILTDWR